jgi:glycolate oxidase FAD binding subunit
MTVYAPASADELARIVGDARAAGTPLAVSGGGTRAGLGRPMQAGAEVSTRNLTGITLYEPAELVIAAKAGTPLAAVTETLSARGQRLPFEPMDHRRLYGTTGEATVGGVAACNVSGPARINLGAARDSMIGLKFVNGRGEDIKSGGRVMKNVTGLDLVKTLAGSHGTLGVFHEVCFKVLPRAEAERTLVLVGLDDADAIAALSAALGSPFEPTGAAHLPGEGAQRARTLLRIEGVPSSLDYRAGELGKLLRTHGALDTLDNAEAISLWADIRDATFFAGVPNPVWRLSVPPSKGAALGAALKTRGARVFYDWGGGLVWAMFDAEGDPQSAFVHGEASRHGGYATLLRASEQARLTADVFSPPAAPLLTLQRKLKASFDPDGILNPGRMYAGL